MDDKLEKILAISEQTFEKVNREDGLLLKAVHFFEKLIIPTMIATLAFVANNASNKIAASQLSLAQTEASRSDTKHRDELKAKYIEIFISEINSKDELRQKNALSVLNMIDNDLAREIAKIVEKNINVSDLIKDKIKVIKQTASKTTVAHATGRSGNWRRYEACVTIPESAKMDKESVKSKVIGGVGAGPWGNWEGDFRFKGSNEVCRTFAHQIHDQDRLLEISVEYNL